jgi:hypothetical protein
MVAKNRRIRTKHQNIMLIAIVVLLSTPTTASLKFLSVNQKRRRQFPARISYGGTRNVSRTMSSSIQLRLRLQTTGSDTNEATKNEADDAVVDEVDVSQRAVYATTDEPVTTPKRNDEFKVRLPSVDESEHDSAVMNRLLRPYQYGELLQTIVGRSIFVFVVFGFLLQFFGYSYIIEYDKNDVTTITTKGIDGTETTIVQRTAPPKFRIGTIEERDFLQEIRREMKN